MTDISAPPSAGAPAVPPIRRRGLMLLLSSPSGAGKSSIARGILETEAEVTLSVSVTTRPPRPGEIEGRDYFFTDAAGFRRMLAEGRLLEHAQVFGHLYGTPAAPVEAALAAGRDVLFDIDWQGAQQLAEKVRDDLARVFLLPPSTAELARRLKARGQDSSAVIAARMAEAAAEMSHYPEYDWVVINHNLQDSIRQVRAILTSERLRRRRQLGLGDFVAQLRTGATPHGGGRVAEA